MDLVHTNLHSHLPVRGLCHCQINVCPKLLGTSKRFLKVLATAPTLNYFYSILSSISSSGYQVVFEHFSQLLRQFCQSQQHWGMLLHNGHSSCSYSPIPFPVPAMHYQLWFCTTAPTSALGFGCSSKCQRDFLLH